MAQFRVLVGLTYPDGQGGERRVEAGEVAADIPTKSQKWLLEQHLIEPAEEAH